MWWPAYITCICVFVTVSKGIIHRASTEDGFVFCFFKKMERRHTICNALHALVLAESQTKPIWVELLSFFFSKYHKWELVNIPFKSLSASLPAVLMVPLN